MSATTKIAVGVAGGYLLGRTKKLRLALTLGSMLAGQRLMTNQRELVGQGLKALGASPDIQKLRGDVSGKLRTAARDAALGVASSRMERFTESLRGSGADEDEAEEEEPEELEEPEDEAVEEPEAEDEPEDAEEPQDQDEPEEEPEDEPRRAKKSTARKAPTKKAPAKKAAAKKAPAKKTSAKKTAAKKTSSRSRTRR